MRPTLFAIPDQIYGVNLFGVGLLLVGWLIFSVITIVMQYRRDGWGSELQSFLMTSAIVAVIIVGLSPMVLHDLPGGGRGLPIRGYGVMLLLAIVSGVSLAAFRGSKVGLAPDTIVNLAFCMILAGIVGARLFWIIQYWDLLVAETIAETLKNVFNFVEGGLVVYGSLIGGLAAAIWFLRRQKLPLMAMADLIAPSLALGLAIGRIGCLLNGCCYGGVCEKPWAITFPSTAAVYAEQKSKGQLHGFLLVESREGEAVIGSPGDVDGLEPGDVVQAIDGHTITKQPAASKYEVARQLLESSRGNLQLTTNRGVVTIAATLPDRSLPVHPTQIYSTINACLLCLLLVAFFPYRRRDGEVIALLLTLYPLARFLLEQIRQDEPGRFGTSLTISQIVSLLLMVVAIGLWIYLARQPRRTTWAQGSDRNDTGTDPLGSLASH